MTNKKARPNVRTDSGHPIWGRHVCVCVVAPPVRGRTERLARRRDGTHGANCARRRCPHTRRARVQRVPICSRGGPARGPSSVEPRAHARAIRSCAGILTRRRAHALLHSACPLPAGRRSPLHRPCRMFALLAQARELRSAAFTVLVSGPDDFPPGAGPYGAAIGTVRQRACVCACVHVCA